ncbi:WG containing repeat-containing protein [Parapedobacter composti]|uniref:WG containing repeat-containing protein n=1 Tax=Parapedobacter composti TaxID=623281 RepID=A0A1I1F1G9_9SPHI|nr:WG repeat-containing protein [Parapedobacter composti]SFB91598.1 WG containing repeat-containing protein [Parapedobacter composti]
MRNGCAHPIALALAAVLSTSASACMAPPVQPPSGQRTDTMKHYLYLAADGRYGYADEQMNVVIPPSFRSAGTFTSTGFAVVEDEQLRYGVIDKSGELVIPFRYRNIYLRVAGNRTLARTERTYTNRLRFWEWRFLPGFSITGGSSDSRLFDTEVKRAHVKITVLETNQTIYSQRVPAASSYGQQFAIRPLDKLHFLQGNRLFKLTDRKVKRLARHIFDEVDGGLLLQQRGNGFRLIDREGKPASGTRYRQADSLHTAINGLPLSIAVSSNRYDDACRAMVLADDEGHQYIFPDFSKAFPARIDAAAVHGVAADTVLRTARLISGMPGTDRFMLRWFNRQASWFEHTMVDTAGHWHMDPPLDNKFTVVIPSGDIRWPPAGHIIRDEAVETGWRIVAYRNIADELYEVTIKRDSTERMGVWDAGAGNWRWKPEHHYIRCLNLRQGYWTFKPGKDSLYGLYHLPSGRVVIPPKYHDMSADGTVSYYDEKLGYTRFYVNWQTQQEFREKSN